MTDDEKRFVELVARTGRCFVAKDVYEALKKLRADPEASSQLVYIHVELCAHLPPGTAMAATVSEIDWPPDFLSDEPLYTPRT